MRAVTMLLTVSALVWIFWEEEVQYLP